MIVGLVAAGDNHRNRRCVQAERSFIPRAICLTPAFLPGNPITRKARSIALIVWQSQDVQVIVSSGPDNSSIDRLIAIFYPDIGEYGRASA
ncbi:hypothetical protein, partial [Brucella inopinata]|uniref:hypothetical protein n=1 Tax=Brucella inopinata TaxID=1218315 RepID=UPI0019D6B6C5